MAGSRLQDDAATVSTRLDFASFLNTTGVAGVSYRVRDIQHKKDLGVWQPLTVSHAFLSPRPPHTRRVGMF